jgi:hypothetical protein
MPQNQLAYLRPHINIIKQLARFSRRRRPVFSTVQLPSLTVIPLHDYSIFSYGDDDLYYHPSLVINININIQSAPPPLY